MKKVALALGGGGAKFFAHLGMIDVLKENNVDINYISAASMGSIAGALVANDVEVQDIKSEFYKVQNAARWFKPSFKKHGMFSHDAITNILNNLLLQHKIEKSRIKFSVVASNILDGKIHLFQKGDINTAVCASCSFPGIYPPVKFEGKMLVDGGVLNNIPADICRKKVGKKGVVISSSLDANLNCKMEDIKTSFDIYQRIIYLPMYEKRNKIVSENSNFYIRHFSHRTLSLKTSRDIFMISDKKMLEKFYDLGRKNTEMEIKKILAKVDV